ncbi:hypothetical protein AVEN_112844-1 [Araneus ventricosus]|uniref:Uncharacterized protein n=1 Tax=Araneus ventricosus TaxID=182803 RepID=A0A4Y2E945_ARAVE|nr:hypothetical protein AVEN_112844-1 [Araneus ventricosus]
MSYASPVWGAAAKSHIKKLESAQNIIDRQITNSPWSIRNSRGKSLPSNAGLMVGKRVLQGEAWSDLSDSRGTHDLGDNFGDKFGDLGDK